MEVQISSLIPRPPHKFFVLRFVLSIIHGSGRAAKNALWFIAHKPVVGHRPHYIHLASTRCHSLDRCSQAFPIFRYSSTSVYYCERKLKNGGRPGNKATQSPLKLTGSRVMPSLLAMASYIVLMVIGIPTLRSNTCANTHYSISELHDT